jgi:threonine/homoserine/homoserine lactone efflux protein
MMTLHTLLTFIAAVTVLMLIPGPNVALITAQSVAHGWRCGLLTVAGTASAMALQLLCTWAGLSALLGEDAKFSRSYAGRVPPTSSGSACARCSPRP